MVLGWFALLLAMQLGSGLVGTPAPAPAPAVPVVRDHRHDVADRVRLN